MALNITFDGFCYLNDNSLSNLNVKYQAHFYKVNGASPSQWNDIRTVENTGYWNCNLGDGDWLGQTGSVAPGDRVVIVFWKPTSAGRTDPDCTTLQQWGAFQITLTAAETYTQNTQIKTNICPNLSWNMQTYADVYDVVPISNSSNDIHSWSYGSVTMWQRNNYNTAIQTVNTIDNTDYDYDDGNQDIDLPGVAGTSHSWTTKGDYLVEIVIEDNCGCTVTGTKPIRIFWREPECGITCHQANVSNEIVTPDTQVTFEYSGTEYDNNIIGIEWKIHDSGAYGSTNTTTSGATASGVVSHSNGVGTDWYGNAGTSGAFTNPGSHLVEYWITWWDGFDYHVKYCPETFEQLRFSGPAVSFDQDPDKAVVASGVKFVNTSTSTTRVGTGLPDGDEYEWRWDDNGNYTYYYDKPHDYELEVTPTTEFCNVRLCAEWSDGWTTASACVEEPVPFQTIVTLSGIDCYYGMHVYGTADDGTVGAYNWDIYMYTTYSGVGPPTGSTELLWESPVGLDQKYKEVAFTQIGWYKVVGWVYPDPTSAGTETYAYENLEITEVCADTTASGVCMVIWNGTGALDYKGDWTHSGHGTESSAAKYSGTNGLDASGMSNPSDKITFSSGGVSTINLDDYTFLSLWVNIQEWDSGEALTIRWFGASFQQAGTGVDLGDYISTEVIGEWQNAVIPISAFSLAGDKRTARIRLTPTGNIGVYLDDIKVCIGVGIAICPPVAYSQERGGLHMTGKQLRPNMKAIPEETPCCRDIKTFPFYIDNL